MSLPDHVWDYIYFLDHRGRLSDSLRLIECLSALREAKELFGIFNYLGGSSVLGVGELDSCDRRIREICSNPVPRDILSYMFKYSNLEETLSLMPPELNYYSAVREKYGSF